MTPPGRPKGEYRRAQSAGVPTAPPLPTPVPTYFGPSLHPLLGWYHASRGASNLAMLLVGPWGDEDLGAYRGLRTLAGEVASAGVPVLRFDWAGQGDSFDLDRVDGGQDHWPHWLASAQAAMDELRRLSGARQLVVAGVRLGALLAAHAGAGRADVAGLLGLLPPASGKAWLREVRLAGAAAGAETAGQGEVAAGGFVLNAATAARVGSLGWPVPGQGTEPGHALVLSRADLPPPASALSAWSRLAVRFAHEPRDDLGALLAVAHSAVWPAPLLDHLANWVAGIARTLPAAPASLADTASPSSPSVVAQGIEESVVEIGAGAPDATGEAPMVGVLCRPAGRPRAGAPLRLLLSSGAERRIGPHRLWVPLARQRAQRGEVVLRLDLPGLGDSPERPGELQAAIYDERFARDLARAVAWLQQQHGDGPVTVMGICSGAYHAWRAAVADLPVQSVVAVNPLVYHWRPDTPLDPVALDFGQMAIASDALRSARDPARWRKLLRGEVNVRVILRALAGRASGSLRSAVLPALHAVGLRVGQDLGHDLHRATTGGRTLHFVFSEGDPGLALLQRDARSGLQRLCRSRRVQLHLVPGADHTFMGLAGRQRFHQHLHALLEEPSSSNPQAHPVTRSLGLP